jgi:hypothetical protein
MERRPLIDYSELVSQNPVEEEGAIDEIANLSSNAEDSNEDIDEFYDLRRPYRRFFSLRRLLNRLRLSSTKKHLYINIAQHHSETESIMSHRRSSSNTIRSGSDQTHIDMPNQSHMDDDANRNFLQPNLVNDKEKDKKNRKKRKSTSLIAAFLK